MSEPITTAHDAAGHPVELHAAHPNRDGTYVKVALLLAVLTGIETLTYFESVIDFGAVTVPLLLVLMTGKFYLIAAYFMHLRWDKPILRRAFLTGIIVALFVYIAALLTFKFFAGVNVMPT